MTWRKIGSGSFNTVYINTVDDYYKKFVFKVLKDPRATTDLPERSVYLWNLINPTLLQAQIHEDPQLGKGWLAPFIKGVQASDEEISLTLIEIYKRTGRIIIDALSPENFMRTEDHKVICIDIGMALKLEPLHQRASSPTSVYAWLDLHHDYNSYFLQGKIGYPQTVDTIKALLYIKLNPALFKEPDNTLHILEQSSEQRALFAKSYDQQHQQQGSLQLRHLTALSTTSYIQPIGPAPLIKAATDPYLAPQTKLGFFHQRIPSRVLPTQLFPPRINPFPMINGVFSARGGSPFFAGSFFFNPTDPVSLAQAHRLK